MLVFSPILSIPPFSDHRVPPIGVASTDLRRTLLSAQLMGDFSVLRPILAEANAVSWRDASAAFRSSAQLMLWGNRLNVIVTVSPLDGHAAALAAQIYQAEIAPGEIHVWFRVRDGVSRCVRCRREIRGPHPSCAVAGDPDREAPLCPACFHRDVGVDFRLFLEG